MEHIILSDERIFMKAKKILIETMNTSWRQSTVAERKLAIYAAAKESRTEEGEAKLQYFD